MYTDTSSEERVLKTRTNKHAKIKRVLQSDASYVIYEISCYFYRNFSLFSSRWDPRGHQMQSRPQNKQGQWARQSPDDFLGPARQMHGPYTWLQWGHLPWLCTSSALLLVPKLFREEAPGPKSLYKGLIVGLQLGVMSVEGPGPACAHYTWCMMRSNNRYTGHVINVTADRVRYKNKLRDIINQLMGEIQVESWSRNNLCLECNQPAL